MIEYPKIETLYNRDDKFKVKPSELRLPEFELVKRWFVTEKIDGTNVRVNFAPDGTLTFGGRTDNAQMPTPLLAVLQKMFTSTLMETAFPSPREQDVTLFGEGYGAKIQKGGGDYRADGVSFRLFDVRVADWWLNMANVQDVAQKLNIQVAPFLACITHLPQTKEDLMGIVGTVSAVSLSEGGKGFYPEGIVCRTDPLLFTRKGDRLMWKLKYKDF